MMRQITPKGKRFKLIIVRIVFFIFGRGICVSSRFDSKIQNELKTWPENLTLKYTVDPIGPSLVLKKANNRLNMSMSSEADLIIVIKSIEIAYQLLTAQMGTIQAFMEHRATMKGDVVIATSLIRILNRVQTYLFPRVIVKRLIKRPPKIPWYTRYYGRIRIMILGIPFGI